MFSFSANAFASLNTSRLPALIFAIWYIYHQAQVKTFEKIIQNNFEILKDLLETNQYHAAILSRIESKIDNNLWCPILKKEVV